jgi:hypothetical protein
VSIFFFKTTVVLPLVYIFVLNYNGWDDTIECLESIVRNSYPHYRIIVIDNASNDPSVEKIKAWAAGQSSVSSSFLNSRARNRRMYFAMYDRETAEQGGNPETEKEINLHSSDEALILIQTGENLGFAGGNNVGIRYALKRKAEYVWLLNNDTVVEPDAVSSLVNLAETDEDIGMTGSTLLSYDNPALVEACGGGNGYRLNILGFTTGFRETPEWQFKKSSQLDYIFGTSLLAKSTMIKDIGLLDEDYFFFSEDKDWSMRAKQKGWKLHHCPQSIVYHKGSRSIQQRSPSRDYYFVRNNLFFVKKFFPSWLPVVFSRFLFRICKRAITRDFRNVIVMLEAFKHFFQNKKGMYIR